MAKQAVAVKITILVPRDVEVGDLWKMLIEAVAQAHAALDELPVEGGHGFASALQNLDDYRAANFPGEVDKPARFAVSRHGDCDAIFALLAVFAVLAR